VNVGQNQSYVFVIDNQMKAQMRPVHVLYQDQTVAALANGPIKPGDKVVTDGQLRLTPGARVTVTQAPGDAGAQSTPQPANSAEATPGAEGDNQAAAARRRGG